MRAFITVLIFGFFALAAFQNLATATGAPVSDKIGLPFYFYLADMFTGYDARQSKYEAIGILADGSEVPLGLDERFAMPVKGSMPRYYYARDNDPSLLRAQLVRFAAERYAADHAGARFARVQLRQYSYSLDPAAPAIPFVTTLYDGRP